MDVYGRAINFSAEAYAERARMEQPAMRISPSALPDLRLTTTHRPQEVPW